MRIRSTKPEFWRSKRVSDRIKNWEHRLVLKALESYVDDNGVGKDELALIVSDTFPHDMALEPSRVFKRVQEALGALNQAGFIHRYEANGDNLLFISWWERTQYINRPSKGRFPRPDGTLNYGDSEIGEPLLSIQEDDLSPQALNRLTGEQVSEDQRNSKATSLSSSRIADTTPRPDVEAILDHLENAVEANGAKRPKRNKQAHDAARLMLDRDGYTPEQVTWLINYATRDPFWKANILSMSKLRAKADTLKLQAQRAHANTRPSIADQAAAIERWYSDEEPE